MKIIMAMQQKVEEVNIDDKDKSLLPAFEVPNITGI
jgi:hypothetical protein